MGVSAAVRCRKLTSHWSPMKGGQKLQTYITLGFKQKEALKSEQQTYYLQSKKHYHNSLGRIKDLKKKKEADESYFNAEKMYRHYVNFKNNQKAHVSYKDLYE